jgi:tRNA-specific 2-thiouridylase
VGIDAACIWKPDARSICIYKLFFMMMKKKKVFVAMSGGVDSSVAAALLKQKGHQVVGITMCFNISYPENKRPSCCGVAGIEDAKRAADILKIPHYVLPFEEDFKNLVIENFVLEYQAGRTPNPCVRCNQFIKFGALYRKVVSLGAEYLATGHYARIVFNRTQRRYELRKARDSKKDQSYFLYSIDRDLLGKILFPLGELRKDQVRQLARKFHLNTAEKKESQDICFAPKGGYKEFIKEYFKSAYFQPGPFIDYRGQEVGRHKGLIHYTIGQREKLGLALGYPTYVFRIEKKTNSVYVGPQEYLYADGLMARHVHFLGKDIFKIPGHVKVKIRYNAPQVKARLVLKGRDEASIIFDRPQKAVTPGQSVVFYDGDRVLGGGIIEKNL